MAKSKKESVLPDNASEIDKDSINMQNGTEESNELSEDELLENYQELLGQAKTWVQDNQGVAMIGAFGVGVFLGVLMRR